jgi:hypothetical protein
MPRGEGEDYAAERQRHHQDAPQLLIACVSES